MRKIAETEHHVIILLFEAYSDFRTKMYLLLDISQIIAKLFKKQQIL